ncbi:ABC transporter ATP-binding protein [Paracoccus gahaiensis]|uniref:ABC transporter ATP-binding protein n=2 Tax=Paracoccus TaxID=265 RepID=A0A4Y5ST61_9RHOB|nr:MULTISPECIES: ABC transporter ATP-binding protein [Paracoccus]QDA36068.1 ABC transporter ATP-binding protein [Paracoccus liaowanqingii]TJZ90612.1 ABC transporter ATP-binding protein [Paracoccus gahaiensis]
MNPIHVRDLSITLGAVQILHGISFDVRAGECFGLVGESGSGKSTILRCLSLLMSSWQGEVLIGGENLRAMPLARRCKTVQMVFQDPYGSLHPRQSVRTTLSEPLRIHSMPDREARITRTMIDVGLPLAFLDRFPHQLSGGQRQRVAIARALILEPEILLLDEPTSALDVSVQAEILNLLSDLQARRGFTYIMVSHDLAVVDHMCDRFAVMQKGHLVETLTRGALTGIPEEQARHPYARELIDASIAYDRAM